MTMNRRSVLKNLGGAGTLVGLAGCIGVQTQESQDNSKDDTKQGGTAEAWYALPNTEIPLRKELISSFNEQSPHTIDGADIADMKKKTTTAIPAGQGPATFDFAHDLIGEYYQNGFIVDQTGKLSVSLDVFTNAAAQAVKYDDSVVGLPYSAETVTLIYNTDIVDKAPKTVEEMVSVMKGYHNPEKGQYGLSYPFNPYFTSAWLQAFGGYYFNIEKDDILGIANPETIKGLEYTLDTFRPYMPDDPKYGAQTAPFSAGNAAFAINGPWYLATLNEKGVNSEVTTLPAPEGGKPNPYTGIRMRYFAKGMLADEATATATREYVQWASTNEDHIIEKAKKQGAIPVLKSVAGGDQLPDVVQAFAQTVEQGVPMPVHPKMQGVWAAMGPALIAAFTGTKQPQQALEDAAANVRENWK